ncbi:ryncolin-4-like [Montipora capricornis]|uniref:ryncolin-4-like n=1 Tax=Montipora capricornis TaxID=246305 RepID=UPI0035F1044D
MSRRDVFFTTQFGFELVLYALLVNQPVALSGNIAAKLKTATKHCNNIYFYAGSSTEKIEAMLKEMKKQLTHIQSDIDTLKGANNTVRVRRDCAELYKSGERISGFYKIDPDGSGAFDVFCDQTTAGGGWTVFQKRLDGSVDFYRNWSDYKIGFGTLNGEFWLGLDKIHRLTKLVRNTLRVDLEDTTGKTAYATYDMFAVTSEKAKYQLSLGSYSGTAGDSLSYHRGAAFSTKDNDQSGTCAVSFKGAWWYTGCHRSNLNGLYHHGKHSS